MAHHANEEHWGKQSGSTALARTSILANVAANFTMMQFFE